MYKMCKFRAKYYLSLKQVLRKYLSDYHKKHIEAEPVNDKVEPYRFAHPPMDLRLKR